MKPMHKRPNGSWTEDAELAMREWNKVAEPFEKLGFQVIGYDPGILLHDPSAGYNTSFSLPTYAAVRIACALEETQE